uniref:Uncharacterized protein n=1 Tax=Photinus pyralis TaxID=7054 RepID=A0A1Y1NC08_PHOPY
MYGHGPKIKRAMAAKTIPMTIIDQWLLNLSVNHPQNGLDIPYNAENRKKIKPICSGDKLNSRRCGSRVGSRNAQILEITIITILVIITAGTFNSFKMEPPPVPTTKSLTGGRRKTFIGVTAIIATPKTKNGN